jgi:LmbE family N-acetylglucosaminyl deacetylase
MNSIPGAAKFSKSEADVFVPDGVSLAEALRRTTHLCVSAHQDDVEIFAGHGILECFGRPDKWFTAVIVTDGSGSARTGLYQNYSDEQMKAVRKQEQRKAAYVGEYSCVIQLCHKSSEVKNGAYAGVVEDLKEILRLCKPETVYLHNPADKHDTHIATLLRSLAALRSLPSEELPRSVLGCEVWRDLDWVPDSKKIALPVSSHPNLQAALLGVFDSQIEGGKRYDLAAIGRRLANATFYESHAVDKISGITFALDLLPLVDGRERQPAAYLASLVEAFKAETAAKLSKFS